MSDVLFSRVMQSVDSWLAMNETIFKYRNIEIEVIEKKMELLYVTLNFGNCMAAIVVAMSDYAPYSHVSFEAIAMVGSVHKIIYHWYDDEGSDISDIVENLDRAVNIVSEYCNAILK